MADWDLLLTDANIATMRYGEADYGAIADGALAIKDGRIAWLGATTECASRGRGRNALPAGPLDNACIDRLSHPPGVWRRSRCRV